MGLLDWLTEGIGSSMGQDATGTGAALGQTMPQMADPVKPPGMDQPAMVPQAPMPQGTDPMTAGGEPPNGPGLATPPAQVPPPMPSPGPGPAAPPPVAAPPSGPGMPPGPTSLAPPMPAGGGMPGPNGENGPATGILGRALGIDVNRERSMRGALGAGLKAAGENAHKPGLAAFAGSAGSAMEGGQTAGDKGYDQRLKSLQLAVTAQAAGDKAAYNKNYAQYLKGKLEQDTDKVSGKGKAGAWNKPDSQKFIDAQNALSKDPEVHASQKMLEQLSKTGDQGEIAKATAAHNALIQQKQGMYLTGVGLNPQTIAQNMKTPPGSPQNPHTIMNKQDFDTYVKPGQAYKNPADGKIYIRKGGDMKGDQEAAPTGAPAPIQPPGPMPGAVAEPAEAE